jgi:hypothetical protein
MSVLDRDAAKRISAILKKMLSSQFVGESQASVEVLKAVLARAGLTYHDLAVAIENYGEAGVSEIEQRKYTDADAETIFQRGVEKGRKECDGRMLSIDFFDDDGEPRWLAIADYCHNDPGKLALKPNEQQFIEEMPAKLRWRSPTPPMGGFLLSIFWKLRRSLK